MLRTCIKILGAFDDEPAIVAPMDTYPRQAKELQVAHRNTKKWKKSRRIVLRKIRKSQQIDSCFYLLRKKADYEYRYYKANGNGAVQNRR